MEDLVNTLLLQYRNRVPCWVVCFGVAAEVVVCAEEREKKNTVLTQTSLPQISPCEFSPNGKRTLYFALKQPISDT